MTGTSGSGFRMGRRSLLKRTTVGTMALVGGIASHTAAADDAEPTSGLEEFFAAVSDREAVSIWMSLSPAEQRQVKRVVESARRSETALVRTPPVRIALAT